MQTEIVLVAVKFPKAFNLISNTAWRWFNEVELDFYTPTAKINKPAKPV